MRVAIIIPQKGFKDESLREIVDMLSKWQVEAVVASYSSEAAVGYHGAVVKPKMSAAQVKSSDFDAMVLIDGPGIEQYTLYDFRPLLDTVRHFTTNGKVVAGIGNAVKILARANVIAETKISTPKDEETKRLAVLYKGILTNNYIELDKNVLTLNAPDKAMELANMLLVRLGVK
jgi:putative intracellular protease/amidase